MDNFRNIERQVTQCYKWSSCGHFPEQCESLA